jgi:hypothetical protein
MAGSRDILRYFWRLKSWIVGPLSENRISGSGFFIEMKGAEEIEKAERRLSTTPRNTEYDLEIIQPDDKRRD